MISVDQLDHALRSLCQAPRIGPDGARSLDAGGVRVLSPCRSRLILSAAVWAVAHCIDQYRRSEPLGEGPGLILVALTMWAFVCSQSAIYLIPPTIYFGQDIVLHAIRRLPPTGTPTDRSR